MASVDWRTVQTFVVTSVERPATVKRNRTGWGRPAVRVARGPRDLRVLAPCAFLGTAETRHPGLDSLPEHTLYEDPDARRLLCHVEPAVEADGERRHVVRDGQGQMLGTVTRVRPKRPPFKHTWRLEQPGHPAVQGCNAWVSGDSRKIAERVAGTLFTGVLSAIADPDGEGGDRRSGPRTLEWRADGQVVLVSEGSGKVSVRAGWLDRRLAFAFALVGDQ